MSEELTKTFVITNGERFFSGFSRGNKPVFSLDNPLTFEAQEEAEEYLSNLKAEEVHPSIKDYKTELNYY